MSRLPTTILLVLPLLLTAADWPVADGPAGTNVAPLPAGTSLIDTPADTKLLWKSADRIPQTYGTDGRKCSAKRAAGSDVGSGYCAPIVHAGKVYLYYHRPGGDAIHADAVKK